jgi:hypothetical protein
MAHKWIASAIKHHGALHKQMGVPEGEDIPCERLQAAAQSPGLLGKRARLALTLKAMHEAKESDTEEQAEHQPSGGMRMMR